LAFNAEDQIIAETMLTRDGKVVHPKFGGEEVANG
jgi:NAD(P) transhydrogenase subunit alpha